MKDTTRNHQSQKSLVTLRSHGNRDLHRRLPSGFVLVVSLTMMILLTIVAVGLLSLSAVSLRSAGQTSAQAEAQANARLALMIAIGELQKQMGPDQRISANGAITDPIAPVEHPHWTGVWDSWVAGDLAQAPVGADYPSAESHHQTIGSPPTDSMRPEYANKSDHFRRWLVSLDEAKASDIAAVKDALDGVEMPTSADTAIRLVGQGSLGNDGNPADFVSAGLIQVESAALGTGAGRYGWWIGDESQKARIMADSYERQTLTRAESIQRWMAPASTGTTTVVGLGAITDDAQLASLPSLRTLDLVNNVTGRPSQTNFHSISTTSHAVLADVREGGLKRDLNALLERPIPMEPSNESGDEFMLYRFDAAGQDRVPIQDLAAYYQLYQDDPSWTSSGRGGIEHNAGGGRAMQVRVPDYGASGDRDRFLREYTALYRNPVPIRVQFALGVGATEITDEERDEINARQAAASRPPLRDSDRYKLLLGVKPVVTLWNPNNVPLVMGTDATQHMSVSFPPFAIRWAKYRADGTEHQQVNPSNGQPFYTNLNYAIGFESGHGDGRARSLAPYIMRIQFARNQEIVFQPGEAKMFSIPINPANFLETGGDSIRLDTTLFQAEPFLPDGFYVTLKTAPGQGQSNIDVFHFPNPANPTPSGFDNNRRMYITFGDDDRLDFEVVPEAQGERSRAVSGANEVQGSGFQFWMAPASYVGGQTPHFRNYQFISRFGGNGQPGNPNHLFGGSLMLSGLPERQPIPYAGLTNAIPGSDILDATQRGEARGLLLFTMMAGAEIHSNNSPGAGAGRRTTTRPFLHGSTLSAPQITNDTLSALYDYGWEWQVEKINDVEEAFQDDGNSRGYHGGGYTVNNGVTHVVQQHLPVLPPISIATLSNARLGGFSLANDPVMATSENVSLGGPESTGTLRDAPNPGDFRQTTATGQGGLAPHTLQAIGNSYAHPNIPADRAFIEYTQLLNTDTDAANPPQRTYADHSYLANKALWDQFFFSSITPQLSSIPLYGGQNRTETEVANDFFFNGQTLPNRRFVPYLANLDNDEFTNLMAEWNDYQDGFADRVASHMMYTGPFNINSTSVDAWRVFFSSLKGKPLTHFENHASSISSTTSAETPVAGGMLTNGPPIPSGALGASGNNPPQQWTSARMISDEEIDQLAEAMVRQVKLRGPFLSLSEFINRRLDGDNTELSLKGALQAALDDPSVTINAAFRTTPRQLDAEVDAEAGDHIFRDGFPEAANGPIAYGSNPYVDQANVLQQLGSALTPRGDTFVIRTYGDALDSNGKVLARA